MNQGTFKTLNQCNYPSLKVKAVFILINSKGRIFSSFLVFHPSVTDKYEQLRSPYGSTRNQRFQIAEHEWVIPFE